MDTSVTSPAAPPTPSRPSSTQPKRKLSSVLIFVGIGIAILVSKIGSRQYVTVRNTTPVVVMYSYAEHVRGKDREHAEFIGVLTPGATASLRAGEHDHFIFWGEPGDVGRTTIDLNGLTSTIHVELSGDRLIAREFKPGETMP